MFSMRTLVSYIACATLIMGVQGSPVASEAQLSARTNNAGSSGPSNQNSCNGGFPFFIVVVVGGSKILTRFHLCFL
jgi:hypothetical protein